MRLEGRVVVVTGAGSGIGAALCRRFAAERPAGIVVADLDLAGAERTAADVEAVGTGALAIRTDVGVEADVQAMVAAAEARFGPVEVLCQNAGIARGGGAEAPDGDWAASWAVNVMAHVYGARAVLPGMLERGEGYLVHTCSAAGLLTNPGAAPYAVTKHAAVAFAEWLAMTHGDQGLRVSALCPQGVNTPMLNPPGATPQGDDRIGQSAVKAAGGVLEPDQVADVVVEGIDAERFLILPHPEVAEFVRRKAADHDRWLGGMRRLVARAAGRA
jgi:NAD(P)-dependent dehydrogenase (short-subunit alcohol dehydrogenase family)